MNVFPLLAAALGLAACTEDEPRRTQLLLSRAQVVGVATAANRGEVHRAQTYLVRSGKKTQVHEYAVRMVRAHTATLHRQQALARTLGITAAPSTTQLHLQAKSDEISSTIETTEPRRLDRIYIAAEVQAHSTVLQVIDEELLPSATVTALRDDLVRARGDVIRHLVAAQDIEARLVAAGDDVEEVPQ
jgi:predicted outer membrane protein